MAIAKPLRALWLIKGLGRGGAETILEASLEHFDREAVTVEVAYVLAEKNSLVPRLEDLGITVHCLSSTRSGGWVRNLRRLLGSRPYDVIHTHSPLVAVAARMVAAPRQIVIHTEHDVWEQYVLPTRITNALTMRRNQHVFAISKAVMSSMLATRARRVAVGSRPELLYHGIDLNKSAQGPRARWEGRAVLGVNSDDYALVMVASMTARKNHELLLRALRALLNDSNRILLFLAGSGPNENQIRSLVDEWNLQDRVIFMGVRSDIRDLLPAFDALILPSKNEGLGMVLIEALSAGIPVVATRVGGIPEVVDRFPGAVLVEPGDPEALAVAIRKVLIDPEIRTVAEREGPHYARQFDIASTVQSMTDAYQSLMQRRGLK